MVVAHLADAAETLSASGIGTERLLIALTDSKGKTVAYLEVSLEQLRADMCPVASDAG